MDSLYYRTCVFRGKILLITVKTLLDTLNYYHTEIWSSPFGYLLTQLIPAIWVANSVDLDKVLCDVMSDQGHCLFYGVFIRILRLNTINHFLSQIQ